jgi:hypothetical protein
MKEGLVSQYILTSLHHLQVQETIYWKVPSQSPGWIPAYVTWGKKYEKAKRKGGKSYRKRERGKN